MGLELYPGRLKNQADSIIGNLREDNQALMGVLNGISQFTGNEELKSAAWSSMKGQLGNHQAVIQGLICGNEAVIQGNETLKGAVGNEDLIEDELNDKIENLQSANQQMQNTINRLENCMRNPSLAEHSSSFYSIISRYYGCMGANDILIRDLQDKIEKLYRIEAETSSLFAGADSLYGAVSDGIAAIGKGWNGSGFSASLGMPEWKKSIKTSWDDRIEKLNKETERFICELEKKVPNITLEEWQKLFDLCNQNPEAEIPTELIQKMFADVEKIPEEFRDNVKSEVVSRVLESSGKSIVKLGDLFLSTGIHGPAGENSFVILSNTVARQGSDLIKTGTKIQSFAKYGLPIIGAAIDFGSQLYEGEEIGDATIKTVGHLGMGAVAGTVGPILGSAVALGMGLGPVGVAVAGVVVCEAFATILSRGFDYVYENNFLGLKDAGDVINKGAEKVRDKISDIGNAVSGFFSGLGCAFA